MIKEGWVTTRSEKLRRAIEARGGRKAVARKLSVAERTVRRWVEDGVRPREGTLYRAADLFGLPASELWPSNLGRAAPRFAVDGTEQAGEVARYEEALWRWVTWSGHPLRVVSRSLRYEIGQSADVDRVTEEYEIEAMGGEQPVLWYRVWYVGGGTDDTPRLRSFREMPDRHAYQLIEGRKSPLYLYSLGLRRGSAHGMVIFEPPVDPGLRRRWGYSMTWEGLWNSLRSTGKDQTALDLRGTLPRFELITLTLVFPINAQYPEVMPIERTPNLPLTKVTEDDGRVAITVRMESIEQREYVWAVHAQHS
jgi:transcriptional regulator with XRE-family HTH domain